MFPMKKYHKLHFQIVATPEEAYVEILDEDDDAIMEIRKNKNNAFELLIYKTNNILVPLKDMENALEFTKKNLR